jgi:hypothetical protein
VAIASAPQAWRSCGFAVEGDCAAVGTVRLRFAGEGGGIARWSLREVASTDLDGLPSERSAQPPPEPGSHPNGALRVDHLVAFTPQLGRTIAAFEAAGVGLRRIRQPEEPGPPVRQAFFRFGEVILEVVENPHSEGDAVFWGITVCVSDLEHCAELLGDSLGKIRDAVQPGRHIATIRREAGLGVPVALITDG